MADADLVEHQPFRRRDPFGVWLGLPLVTFGIYRLVWHYKVNDEARRYLNDQSIDPAVSVLALLLGWVLVIPPLVTIYRTGERIRRMQAATPGVAQRVNPALGLLLAFVFGLHPMYYQSNLNDIWDTRSRQSQDSGFVPGGGAFPWAPLAIIGLIVEVTAGLVLVPQMVGFKRPPSGAVLESPASDQPVAPPSGLTISSFPGDLSPEPASSEPASVPTSAPTSVPPPVPIGPTYFVFASGAADCSGSYRLCSLAAAFSNTGRTGGGTAELWASRPGGDPSNALDVCAVPIPTTAYQGTASVSCSIDLSSYTGQFEVHGTQRDGWTPPTHFAYEGVQQACSGNVCNVAATFFNTGGTGGGAAAVWAYSKQSDPQNSAVAVCRPGVPRTVAQSSVQISCTLDLRPYFSGNPSGQVWFTASAA